MELEISVEQRVARITLSRTNLLSMLHKLDEMGDSARCIMRVMDNGWTLAFRGESDDDHYAKRTRGEMHPMTETYLRRQE